MKKILYLIQGTNLNLLNKSIEYISKEKSKVLFLYIDVKNFNKNGNRNTYLPYIMSLHSYIKDLNSNGINVDYLSADNSNDEKIKQYIKDLDAKFNFDEIVFDKPLLEFLSIKYCERNDVLSEKFHGINSSVFYDLEFKTAKSGAEKLIQFSKDGHFPIINIENILNFENHNYNELIINKKYLINKKVFIDRISNNIVNYRNNRDLTWGSMRISPFMNTGYLSIYELIKIFEKDTGTEGGFHLFREIAFFIIATKNISGLSNRQLEFSMLSKRHLSYQSLENFNEHKSDRRPYLYTLEELENGNTHSQLYNKTVKIVKQTGFLHNRIRMWWISWLIGNLPTYEKAYKFAIYFQNKYCSDARHPVTYFCTIDAFKITPKRDEKIYGRILRMVEDNAKEKIGASYEDLYLKSINGEISFEDVYLK